MLENLLILLNSAAAIGIGPQPEDFGRYEMPQKSASEMPGSRQGIKRGWVWGGWVVISLLFWGILYKIPPILSIKVYMYKYFD